MEFVDCSPPLSPNVEQQHDALRKGLGRAYQWAGSGKLDDEPLLKACLHDPRFDKQVEESRTDWLWRLVETVGAVDRFRSPIRQALSELSIESGANQLCELACHYAEHGEDSFRSLLYEVVEKRPLANTPWLGEEELVRLDGEKAVLFIARVREERAVSAEADWDDLRLVELAIERLGEQRVEAILNTSGAKGTQRLAQAWNQEKLRKTSQTQPALRREQMRTTAPGDIIKAANSEDKCFWLRGWGMHADEAKLKEILEHLWAADSPSVVAKLLRVFSNRPLIEFDPRLIEWCQSADPDLRRSAFNTLAQVAHPLVREFANVELEKGNCSDVIVSLFAKNYRSGDEQRLFEAITLPADENELHWLFIDVIKVLADNPEADCFRLAVSIYRSTPCENCRFEAARLLHRQQVAPQWLAQECCCDSHEKCRALFGQAT